MFKIQYVITIPSAGNCVWDFWENGRNDAGGGDCVGLKCFDERLYTREWEGKLKTAAAGDKRMIKKEAEASPHGTKAPGLFLTRSHYIRVQKLGPRCAKFRKAAGVYTEERDEKSPSTG